MDLVGKVVFIRGDLWRVVCVRDNTEVEAITYPWAAIWSRPTTFHIDEIGVAP